MKSNKRKILALLLGMPLLMANAPAPIAIPEEYTGAEYQIVSSTYNSEKGMYDTVATLKNTGEGYLVPSVTYVIYDDPSYRDCIDKGIEGSVFYSEVIAPGETKTIIGETQDDWTSRDISKSDKCPFEGFSIDEEVVISGTKEITLTSSNPSANHYRYLVDVRIDESKTRYTSYVFDIKVDGEIHHVFCEYERLDCSIDLIAKNATIEKVTAVIDHRTKYNGGSMFGQGTGITLLFAILLIPFLFVLGLGVFIIAPAIVIPKLVRRKR